MSAASLGLHAALDRIAADMDRQFDLLLPIPYNERIKLKGLDQNEGYNN